MNAVTQLQEQLEREASGQEKVMSLPWPSLTHGLGGLRRGTLSLFVGEPGSSKTFAALAICLHAFRHSFTWAYWPFERDSVFAMRRMLAVLVNDWNVLEVGRKENSSVMNDDGVLTVMAKIVPHILQNPRQMRQDEYGNYYVPTCHYAAILGRLRELCESHEFICLDPLSMLSFDDSGKGEWQGQEQFAKDAAALAAQYGTRLFIVHHSRKSAPGGKVRQSSLDEVAGAAALSRFADNVIFLEHHADGIESEVVDIYGATWLKVHKRTLFIAKARDGKGTGWKIAADLSESGPELKELGVIKKKGGK